MFQRGHVHGEQGLVPGRQRLVHRLCDVFQAGRTREPQVRAEHQELPLGEDDVKGVHDRDHLRPAQEHDPADALALQQTLLGSRLNDEEIAVLSALLVAGLALFSAQFVGLGQNRLLGVALIPLQRPAVIPRQLLKQPSHGLLPR